MAEDPSQDDIPEIATPTRCGFVALIGAPNVGKSTLVNALVGSKVTIVSRKVQTTRALIRGIVVEDNAQIILVDTPGIFSPKRRLDRAMVSTAWSGAHDADLVCVLIDARQGIDEEADAIFAKLANVNHPKFLVLNKIDVVPREQLLSLSAGANERLQFDATFMVSALTGDGVDDLRHALAHAVPEGPFHYPEDQMSDAPLRHLAAEITREKIYLRNCRTSPRSKPTAGPSARITRSVSSRRFSWSATASVRSCSARAERRSRRSARSPARRLLKSLECPFICFFL